MQGDENKLEEQFVTCVANICGVYGESLRLFTKSLYSVLVLERLGI